MTVTRSRWLLTLTRRTQKPVSSLKNVTRSIRPETASAIWGWACACAGWLISMAESALFFRQRLALCFRRERQHAKAKQENRAHRHTRGTHRLGIVHVNFAGEEAES